MRIRWTTDSFKEYCNTIHNSKYDYSKMVYKTLHDKITIICKEHGEFNQTANHHKKGHGCPKCSLNIQKERQRSTTEKFIEKATSIHGDKYLYDKTIYGKNAHTGLIVTCKVHGDILVKPNNFLKSGGCKQCGIESIRSKLINQETHNFSRTGWIKTCKGKIAKLYVIRLFDDNETFYKIGITSKSSIKRRFTKIPYKYEIIHLFESVDAGLVFNLEKKLLKETLEDRYIPLHNFEGKTECRSNIRKINSYAECH